MGYLAIIWNRRVIYWQQKVPSRWLLEFLFLWMVRGFLITFYFKLVEFDWRLRCYFQYRWLDLFFLDFVLIVLFVKNQFNKQLMMGLHFLIKFSKDPIFSITQLFYPNLSTSWNHQKSCIKWLVWFVLFHWDFLVSLTQFIQFFHS